MRLRVFHADHGIGKFHEAVIKRLFADAGPGFLIKTVELPTECPDLLSGIHGPIAGDEPVPSSEVHWAKRGNRAGLSRLCRRPARPTRLMTVIGKWDLGSDEIQVFTAYGGPLAPREITDATLPADAAEEACAFWAVHALSAE